MVKKTYPILVYPLSSDSYLGEIPGIDMQAGGENPDAIVKELFDYLQKMYRRNGIYPYPNFISVKLRFFTLNIRPTTYQDGEIEVSEMELPIELPVVCGKVGSGQQLAIIAPTGQRINYRNEKQLRTLVNYFAQGHLQQMNQQQLIRLAQRPNPELHTFQLQVNPARSPRWRYFEREEEASLLDRMTEVFPAPQTVQNKRDLPAVAWERDSQVQQIKEAISQHQVNVLIVGESGVGKTAVLEAALVQLHREARKGRRSFSARRLSARRVLAEAKYLGDWQKTADELVAELRDTNGILWINDVVQMVMTDPDQPEVGLAAYWLPYLQRGQLRMLGEISPRELDFLRYHLPNFVDCFQLVEIEELPESKVMQIAHQLDQYFQQRHQVRISRRAQEMAFRLLRQYYPYQRFPGKLVHFLGRCMREAKQEKIKQLTYKRITHSFAEWTGLPQLFLVDEMPLDAEQVQRYFSDRIIGQPGAVRQLKDIVTIFKAGLQHPEKPIKTLLFAGPTGVGKTLTAKALANFFFGYGQKKPPLITLDMSELKYAFQIDRLIGTEQEPGKLIKEIREKPFSVLLLDEIEKADRAVLDILLRMLDEGILIDRMGRETNFRNTIIIMTSNLGATERKRAGFGEEDEEQRYLTAIQRNFRPEFFNRIDDIVIFQSLDEVSIAAVARMELDKLSKRSGLHDRQLRIHHSSALMEQLVAKGFDPQLGARPMQRMVERLVMTPLSRFLLHHTELQDADIEVDFDGEVICRQIQLH